MCVCVCVWCVLERELCSWIEKFSRQFLKHRAETTAWKPGEECRLVCGPESKIPRRTAESLYECMHINCLRMNFPCSVSVLWIQRCFAFSKQFSNIPLKFELPNWQNTWVLGEEYEEHARTGNFLFSWHNNIRKCCVWKFYVLKQAKRWWHSALFRYLSCS